MFLTGLPASGKTTIAHALMAKLEAESGCKPVLLDGDMVRAALTPVLGFSKEDRDANIDRIGSSALKAARPGAIVVCAAIAPYAEARDRNRALMEREDVAYLEIFVDTPLQTCVARDPKGLYRDAKRGIVKHLTGVDDPYERPMSPDMIIETDKVTRDEAVERITTLLQDRNLFFSQRGGSFYENK